MFPVPDVRKLEQKKRGKEGELWRATPIHAGTMHKARAFRVRVRPVAAIQLSKLDLWLGLLKRLPFPFPTDQLRMRATDSSLCPSL